MIGCSEMSQDDKLALASSIADGLEGKGFTFIRGEDIVIDEPVHEHLEMAALERLIDSFLSRRREGSQYYWRETKGTQVTIHSSDPVDAMDRRKKERRRNTLPPNLKQCPFCPFVTPFDEYYVVHVRSHGAGF